MISMPFSKIISKLLISYLTKASDSRAKPTTNSIKLLKQAIRPGDILLVEGNQRFSTGIKYLTQSNWSHVALYLGPCNYEGHDLLEADLEKGVITLNLEDYASYHTRICRPVGLADEDFQTIKQYCLARLGNTYDLKNIFDLIRYLFPLIPVPTRYKMSYLTFGSGDPTKAICSSLIAEAFQKVHYPIIPLLTEDKAFSKRHPSFYVPSDFDRSPYFDVIKPTLESGFNYKDIDWHDWPDKNKN
jgi:hypothetical protein